MRLHLACLLFALAVAAARAALDCAAYDSCDGSQTTCDCAPSCADKGTCCADAVAPNAARQTLFCRQDRLFSPVYARRRCLRDRSRSALCEESRDDPADVLGNAPYSDPATLATYWNKHCAICNGEKERKLLPWPVQVLCPSRHGTTNIVKSLVIKNLTFDRDSGEWGLQVPDGFIVCSVQYVQPQSLRGRLDYCLPDVVSKCPDDTTDDDLSSKCESYRAERRHKVSGVYFLNPHCALCHGVGPDDLECEGRRYAPAQPEKGDQVRVAFGAGRWLDRPVVCSHGNIFDPFTRTCSKDPPAPRNPLWPVQSAAPGRTVPEKKIVAAAIMIVARIVVMLTL